MSSPAPPLAPMSAHIPVAATLLQTSVRQERSPSFIKETPQSESQVAPLDNVEPKMPMDLVPPWRDWWYIVQVSAIISMLIWPWIFFGAVHYYDGIPMQKKLGPIAHNHASDAVWVVTLISNLFTLTVGFLYATAVKTLALKWIMCKKPDIFFLSFISAARSPTGGFSWLWASRVWIRKRLRILGYAVMLIFYAVMFLLLNSAFNTLLTPQVITKTANLRGTELNFSSADPDCVDWYMNNLLDYENCAYQQWAGSSYIYSTCLVGEQIIDLLESGRNSMIFASQSDNTVTYNQLYGLHLRGPIRGVLPTGPNGVPGFDALDASPLSDGTLDYAISYNYSTNLQGVSTSVMCVYDSESPIVFTLAGNEVTYTGSCPPGQTVLDDPYPPYNLPNYTEYINLEYQNALFYWACYTPAGNSPGYTLYFRGFGDYDPYIGNMTCSMSPAQVAVYPVSYTSAGESFAVGDSVLVSSTMSNEFMNSSVWALGSLVYEAQSGDFNTLVEMAIEYSIKFQGAWNPSVNKTSPIVKDMEAIIQGIFEYEAMYSRLIYTMYNSETLGDGGVAPDSCLRAIAGSVEYQVYGWQVTWHTALFLIALTLVNLTSLVVLIYASFFIGPWKALPRFNPFDPVQLLIAGSRGGLSFTGRNDEDVQDVKFAYNNAGGISLLYNTFERA